MFVFCPLSSLPFVFLHSWVRLSPSVHVLSSVRLLFPFFLCTHGFNCIPLSIGVLVSGSGALPEAIRLAIRQLSTPLNLHVMRVNLFDDSGIRQSSILCASKSCGAADKAAIPTNNNSYHPRNRSARFFLSHDLLCSHNPRDKVMYWTKVVNNIVVEKSLVHCGRDSRYNQPPHHHPVFFGYCILSNFAAGVLKTPARAN
eukprot:g64548.t1